MNGRHTVVVGVIGLLVGVALTLLFAAARAKPPARECLDVCKASNASTFYAADGACLCIPPCPACTAAEVHVVESKEKDAP